MADTPTPSRQAIPEGAARIWERVSIGAPDECWEWTGGRERQGYGRIRIAGRNYLVHRLAFLLAGGEFSDAAPDALHSCDNPPCCNAAHLRAGNDQQNVDDKMHRGRFRPLRGETHGNSKLTVPAVLDIRARTAAGESYKSIATSYGIADDYVHQIARRRAWAHV